MKLTLSGLPFDRVFKCIWIWYQWICKTPSVGYFISERTSIDINFSFATPNDLTLNDVNSYAFIPTIRNNFFNKKNLDYLEKSVTDLKL